MFLGNGLYVLGTNKDIVPFSFVLGVNFCVKTFCNNVTPFGDDNNVQDDDTSFNRSVSHRLWSMTRSNLDALRRKCCKMEQLCCNVSVIIFELC